MATASDTRVRVPISAALILEMVSLELFRLENGMVACSERGVGVRRRMLEGRAKLARETECPAPIIIALDSALFLLRELCRDCPHEACTMKRFTTRPLRGGAVSPAR